MATGAPVPCDLRWIWDGELLGWKKHIWRFPEIGVPQNHPWMDGFSIINHYQPSIWGYPSLGNPHILDVTILCNRIFSEMEWWFERCKTRCSDGYSYQVPDGTWWRWNMLNRGNYWDAQSRQLEFMRNHPKARSVQLFENHGSSEVCQRFIGLWLFLMYVDGSVDVVLVFSTQLWTFTNHI